MTTPRRLRAAAGSIKPGLHALDHAIAALPSDAKPTKRTGKRAAPAKAEKVTSAALPGRCRGVRPREIVEFPEPLTEQWDGPASFHDALALHVRRLPFSPASWRL